MTELFGALGFVIPLVLLFPPLHLRRAHRHRVPERRRVPARPLRGPQARGLPLAHPLRRAHGHHRSAHGGAGRPPQDVITKDNVSVKVSAVVYFRVIQADKAVLQVEDYLYATSQLAQTTLRAILGQVELDDLLSQRDRVNREIQQVLDAHGPVGRQGLQRGGEARGPAAGDAARHRPSGRSGARAAREDHRRRGRTPGRRAALPAADVLSRNPATLQLRYLQTLVEITNGGNHTILPIPLDLLRTLGAMGSRPSRPSRHGPNARRRTRTLRPDMASPEHEVHPRVTHGWTFFTADGRSRTTARRCSIFAGGARAGLRAPDGFESSSRRPCPRRPRRRRRACRRARRWRRW